MFVISPLSRCASPAKRDIFLDHIARIADVTRNYEPKCRGYAWFKSADDNDLVPHHWLRGFEIYEEVEANTLTHRASPEYKAFRVAVGEENLLEQPSDLRFWRPTEVGFLTRAETMHFSSSQVNQRQYIVVDEVTLEPGKSGRVLGLLEGIAARGEDTEQVLSFWVLQREDGDEFAFLVLSIYLEKESYEAFNSQAEVKDAWAEVYDSSRNQRKTTWIGSGLGFLGR